MRKKHTLRLFFLVPLLFFCGCKKEPVPEETAPLCRVVTQVDVTCRQGGTVLTKQYTQDPKMESILIYLRLLRHHGDLQILPAWAVEPEYEIRLFFSDGAQRVYIQKSNQYLSQDGGPWLILEPSQGRKLMTLIRLMPGDTI